MKIAVLHPNTPSENFWMGSRWKYSEFWNSIFSDEEIKYFEHNEYGKSLVFNPDLYIVWGHMFNSYMFPLNTKKPYIVCEFDAYAFRNRCLPDFHVRERTKLKNAVGIVVTSPEIGDFCTKMYGVNPDVIFDLPLMPLKKHLNFEPLPKRQGNTLVYVGGISQLVGVGFTAGYRYIFPHLIEFQRAGWEIHIYPAPGCDTWKYKEAGMFIHKHVHPDKLLQEISQYTAGFQGFCLTPDYVNPENIAYATAARPNKTYEYLSAGIPTVGYMTGNASDVYDDKWGILLDSLEHLDKLPEWLNRIKIKIPYYRNLNVIDQYSQDFKEYLKYVSS